MKPAALLLSLLVATGTRAQPGVADYLAVGPTPWVPADLQTMLAAPADFIVDAQGGGTHRTVQAAVDAVPAALTPALSQREKEREQDRRRWVIHLRAGTFRETLCIRDKAPLLLRGDAAAAVRIVEGRYNSLPKAVGTAAHPCVPALEAPTHGTGGSTSVAVFSDDVQLAQLTIANDATAPSQAVALTTAGDRIQLEGVQLWSRQDTFYARRREHALPARVFVRDSLMAGDVDFVFGNATLVITHSTLLSRATRRANHTGGTGSGGIVLAPSTRPEVPLGFLITDSRFTAEPGLTPGSVALGRAWDQGVPAGQWLAGVSPNGQARVHNSVLGAHIGPWVASTSGRPFSAGHNRLVESGNRRAEP